MQFSYISRLLIIIGIILVLAGILIRLAEKTSWLKTFPGTIRIQLGGLTCVFPILVSIVVSLFLTIILNIIARIIGR